MSTDTAPNPQTGVATDIPAGTRVPVSSFVSNLREYGLILALIAIMVFFQLTTGTLFKPVNLSNLVQQNSFIIVMALGMLLVIVSGHIDLSVGSVAGFIGALAAMMMVIWPLGGFFANPLVVAILCLIVGGAIGAAQGYWIAYHRIPSFIVTLAGMLVFRGLCQGLLGGGSSVGPAAGFVQGAQLGLPAGSARHLGADPSDGQRRRQDGFRQRRHAQPDDTSARRHRRARLCHLGPARPPDARKARL